MLVQAAHFLGMFPGSGASFILPRLKGHIGMYLALTGACADALPDSHVSLLFHEHRICRLEA
jgi:hypothetical protein